LVIRAASSAFELRTFVQVRLGSYQAMLTALPAHSSSATAAICRAIPRVICVGTATMNQGHQIHLSDGSV
jgi:hypothetical protein